MTTDGRGEMGMTTLPLLVQEPAVTVTARETLPVVPLLKVMAFVPWPETMAPLVMVQTNDAPGCAATLAGLLDDSQTPAGAVIVATGFEETVTVCESVAVQVPLLTVTLYVVVAAGLTVMVCEVAPVLQE